MSITFRICPKCGTRNHVHRLGARFAEWCAKCDGRPTDIEAFNAQVHRLERPDGTTAGYRVQLIDPAGEVIFTREPMERDDARALCARIAEDVIAFIEEVEGMRRVQA